MRSFSVSTDVFAAVWQARQEGEETEDDILRRILGLNPATPQALETGRMGGFYDERSGVHFPEHMRIYRTYKGHKIEAVAHLDRWFVPATGASYHSLHKLSQSVAAGRENSWLNWKFHDDHGRERLIDELRRKDQPQ